MFLVLVVALSWQQCAGVSLPQNVGIIRRTLRKAQLAVTRTQYQYAYPETGPSLAKLPLTSLPTISWLLQNIALDGRVEDVRYGTCDQPSLFLSDHVVIFFEFSDICLPAVLFSTS